MKKNVSNIWPFFLATVAAWTFAVVGGLWLMDSALIQSISNGFLAFGVVSFAAVLLISGVQRMLLQKSSLILWLLATAAGFGTGVFGMIFASFITHAPLVRWTSGNPWVDWLLWLAFLFILTALVSGAGGLIAGLLQKWALGQGALLSWMGVSILNWGLSFGAGVLLMRMTRFFRFFYSGNLRHPSTLVRGAAFGVLVGVIQGAILGRRLAGLSEPDEKPDLLGMTKEEVSDRLNFGNG